MGKEGTGGTPPRRGAGTVSQVPHRQGSGMGGTEDVCRGVMVWGAPRQEGQREHEGQRKGRE